MEYNLRDLRIKFKPEVFILSSLFKQKFLKFSVFVLTYGHCLGEQPGVGSTQLQSPGLER